MADDDIQIEVGEAVRRHILRKPNPLNDPTRAVVAYDSPDQDPIPVFVSDKVIQTMERQALSDKERETGGVLLGGFYRNDDGSFVEITDYVEAGSAKGTDVSLTFTHETWEYIHQKIAQLNSENLQIVGWYHSHPGLGVFLSKDDEFIHSSYFSDPWHVAIVHDPIYTNWGCFKWTDGQLDRTGGFYIYAEKKHGKQVREYVKNQMASRQAPPRSASPSADRLIRPSFVRTPSVWSALAVMLLIQVALSWFFISKRGAAQPVDEYRIAAQMLRCCDLTGAEQHLRMELAAHPNDARAYKELLAVNRALAIPTVAAMKNQDLDRQNMVLALGDQLATKQDIKQEKKEAESVEIQSDNGSFRWGGNGMHITTDFAGEDPMKMVLKAYTDAAPTRGARLTRAKAINDVLKTWWSRESVKWLTNEKLRQIAYGKQVVPLEYQDQYKSLPKNQKAVVDEVFGSK